MNIRRIRIVLPSRLRGDAAAAGRAIAESIAAGLVEAGTGSGSGDAARGRLSVTLPGHGRSASILAGDAAGALVRNTGGRSWR